MTAEDEELREDGSISEQQRAVLPASNLGTAGTFGMDAVVTNPPTVPPFLRPDAEDEEAEDNLAARVEQVLVEDGRFSSFSSHLVITADKGIVHASGSVPNADIKRSLINTIHAIPGVTDVDDNLS